MDFSLKTKTNEQRRREIFSIRFSVNIELHSVSDDFVCDGRARDFILWDFPPK